MKVLWDGQTPKFITDAAANCADGELVHHHLWSQHGGENKICFGENLGSQAVIGMVNDQRAKSLVQLNPDWFVTDLAAAVTLRKDPSSYFAAPGETLLGGVDETWSWDCTDRREKIKIKDEILALSKGFTESSRESLGQIFEELFMNAFIDAPREAGIRLMEKGLDPKLISSGPVRVNLVRQQNRLCLSCEDPHGTLLIQKFLDRMKHVYANGAGQVINFNSDRGGAGLGCVLLFENCSTLALGVAEGQRTTVSCVVPTSLNHRQKSLVQRSFHIVEVTESE